MYVEAQQENLITNQKRIDAPELGGQTAKMANDWMANLSKSQGNVDWDNNIAFSQSNWKLSRVYNNDCTLCWQRGE